VKGEQYVKLFRDLLESAAWQAQSINCRRFVEFLMLSTCGTAAGKTAGLSPRGVSCGTSASDNTLSAAL
jgi:hypothetical protein